MRDLAYLQNFAIEGQATSPQFFVELTLDQPYYWTTRGTHMWNQQTWTPGGIRNLTLSPGEARFQVENDNYRHTQNAMNGSYLRNAVKVWWAYVTPPINYVEPGYWKPGYVSDGPALAKPLLRFDGIISAITEVDDFLTVVCRVKPPKLYPFERVRPPVANHLSGDGYIIEFDGQIIRVESA